MIVERERESKIGVKELKYLVRTINDKRKAQNLRKIISEFTEFSFLLMVGLWEKTNQRLNNLSHE